MATGQTHVNFKNHCFLVDFKGWGLSQADEYMPVLAFDPRQRHRPHAHVSANGNHSLGCAFNPVARNKITK